MKRALFAIMFLFVGIFAFAGASVFLTACGSQPASTSQPSSDEGETPQDPSDDTNSQAISGYWSDYYASSFAGGNGSSTSPYLISTAAQLARMAYYVNSGFYYNSYFKLTANIDLSDHYWVPIGLGIGGFKGDFDGAGYKISGLYFSTSSANKSYLKVLVGTSEAYCVGLFGLVVGGNIHNFVVAYTGNSVLFTGFGSTLSWTDPAEDGLPYYVSLVVAYALGYNNITISQIGVVSESAYHYADMFVNNFNQASIFFGTICGAAKDNTEITECFVSDFAVLMDCKKSSYASNLNYDYPSYYGGIIASGEGVTISDCYIYTSASVYGEPTALNVAYAGGLAGHLFRSNVLECYVATSMGFCATYAGGLVGFLDMGCYVRSCFVMGFLGTSGGYNAGLNASKPKSITAGGIFGLYEYNTTGINICWYSAGGGVSTASGGNVGGSISIASFTDSTLPTTSGIAAFYKTGRYLGDSWDIADGTGALWCRLVSSSIQENFPFLRWSALYFYRSLSTNTLTVGYYSENAADSTDIIITSSSRTSVFMNPHSPNIVLDTAIISKSNTQQVVSVYDLAGSSATTITATQADKTHLYAIQIFKNGATAPSFSIGTKRYSNTYTWTPNSNAQANVSVQQIMKQTFTLNVGANNAMSLTLGRYSSSTSTATTADGYFSAIDFAYNSTTTFTANSTLSVSTSITATRYYYHLYGTSDVYLRITNTSTSYVYYMKTDSVPTLTSYTKMFSGTAGSTGQYYSFSWMPESSVSTTYYIRQRYAITYIGNSSSSVSGLPSTGYKLHGVDYTLPTTRPSSAGHSFDGWSTRADGSVDWYPAGGTYTGNGDTTFYAVWNDSVSRIAIHIMACKQFVQEAKVYDFEDCLSGGSISAGSAKISYFIEVDGEIVLADSYVNYTETHQGLNDFDYAVELRSTASGYVFMGATTSYNLPESNQTKIFSGVLNGSVEFYFWFRRVSDNRLQYDIEEQYWYFEDGEYPQSATASQESSLARMTPDYEIYYDVGSSSEVDHNGNNFFTLGRNLMFTDLLTVNIWAYMDDWTAYAGGMISCKPNGASGGWTFDKSGSGIRFTIYDGAGAVSRSTSTYSLASLSSGWHMFTAVFNGTNATFYIDGANARTTANFTSAGNGRIGYHVSNKIFVGAEAGTNATTPSGSYFTGKTKNVSIWNLSWTAEQVLSVYNTNSNFIQVYSQTDAKGHKYARAGYGSWFLVEPIRWRMSDYGVSPDEVPYDWREDGAGKANFSVVSDKIIGFGAVCGVGDAKVANLNDSDNIDNIWSYAKTPMFKYVSDTPINSTYALRDGQYTADIFEKNGAAYSSSSVFYDYHGEVRVASLGDIYENGYYTGDDFTAKCSDFVALLMGIGKTGGVYADYWTRSFGMSLETGATITSSGKVNEQEWLHNALGFRLAMTMSEGSSLGAGVENVSSDLVSGQDLNRLMKFGSVSGSVNSYDSNITSVIFDYYSDDAGTQYVIDGRNVLSGLVGIDVSMAQNGTVRLYRAGSIMYVLSIYGIGVKDASYMFNGLENLKEVTFNNFQSRECKNFSYMFAATAVEGEIGLGLDTASAKTMEGMFMGCTAEYLIPLFETTNVRDFSYMFAYSYNVYWIDLSTFSFVNADDMTSMFEDCENLMSFTRTRETTIFYATGNQNPIVMDYMFSGCYILGQGTHMVFVDFNVGSDYGMFGGWEETGNVLWLTSDEIDDFLESL